MIITNFSRKILAERFIYTGTTLTPRIAAEERIWYNPNLESCDFMVPGIIVPMIILSGFVFPIENMPAIIQYITALMPLRYYFIIVRGIFLKGADMSSLWDEALIFFILGAIILTLSAFRVKKCSR